MPVFETGDLRESEYHQTLHRGCLRARNKFVEPVELQMALQALPDHLKLQGWQYVLDVAIESSIDNLFLFAQERGVLNLPGVIEKRLEMGMAIRDSFFRLERKVPHLLRFLEDVAQEGGLAFALDSINAVFNKDSLHSAVETRPHHSNQDKVKYLEHAFNLAISMLPAEVRYTPQVGNLAIQRISEIPQDLCSENGFVDIFADAISLKVSDSEALLNVMSHIHNDANQMAAPLAINLLNEALASGKWMDRLFVLLMKISPLKMLRAIEGFDENATSLFIAGGGAVYYIEDGWRDTALDHFDGLSPAQFPLLDRINKRLAENTYFQSLMRRTKVSNPGVNAALMLPHLQAQGVTMDLFARFASLGTFSSRLATMRNFEPMPEAYELGMRLTLSTFKELAVQVYDYLVDLDFWPGTAMPSSEEDREYAMAMVAVSLYLDRDNNHSAIANVFSLNDVQLISQNIYEIEDEDVLKLVLRHTDESVLLKALDGNKEGIADFIKSGFLSNGALKLINDQQRAAVLEHQLGL